MSKFSDYLRYRAFALRAGVKRLRTTSREYFVKLSIIRAVGVRFLDKIPVYSYVFAAAVLSAGNTKNSARLVKNYLLKCHQDIKSASGIRDAMRHALQIGERRLSIEIYEAARNRGVKTAFSEYKHTCLAKGDFEAYVQSYHFTSKKKWVRRYFAEKYVPDKDIEKVLFSGKNIGIISTLGPGDEVAFSTTYSALIEDPRVDTTKIKILCDHRLHGTLQRSFPDVRFVASRRSRYITPGNPYTLYTALPDYGLHVLMCNASAEEMSECDKFIYMHDLGFVYTDYLLNNAVTRRYFPDAAQRDSFSARLPYDTRLVGLLWCSSVSTAARDINYFSIRDLAPIFDVPGITFVNLQYNVSKEAVVWVEARWPGKLITFDDVDFYNDFDSVVAILNCLESVITPPTLMAELSAQAGCKTLLLANTLEVIMRCRPDGLDLWHRNMVQISGKKPGDKGSLVDNLVCHLKKTG